MEEAQRQTPLHISELRLAAAEEDRVLSGLRFIHSRPENIVLYHRLNRAVGKVMLPLFAAILS